MTDSVRSSSTDDPDHYRRRLLLLRSDIASTWPDPGLRARLRGSDGMSQEAFEKIRVALMAVPMLPTDSGIEPVAVLEPGSNDLVTAVDRTIDAGFALLSRGSLSEDYGSLVTCFAPGPDGFMIDVLEGQTVNELLDRIFAALETVHSVLES